MSSRYRGEVLTEDGVFFLGTLDYAAPEQIQGKPVDARTDVYALGRALNERLAGEARFVRDGELAVNATPLPRPPPTSCRRQASGAARRGSTP